MYNVVYIDYRIVSWTCTTMQVGPKGARARTDAPETPEICLKTSATLPIRWWSRCSFFDRLFC